MLLVIGLGFRVWPGERGAFGRKLDRERVRPVLKTGAPLTANIELIKARGIQLYN